jgi:hypothetical protein
MSTLSSAFLAPDEKIIADNIEKFLELPKLDPPGIGGIHWQQYLETCKNRPLEVMTALQTLDANGVKRMEASYTVNFPHLVSMLLKFGQDIPFDEIFKFLTWYEGCNPEEFGREVFAHPVCESIGSILAKLENVLDRLEKYTQLAKQFGNYRCWDWYAFYPLLFQNVFPEGFTCDLVSSLNIEELVKLDKKISPERWDKFMAVLKYSYQENG